MSSVLKQAGNTVLQTAKDAVVKSGIVPKAMGMLKQGATNLLSGKLPSSPLSSSKPVQQPMQKKPSVWGKIGKGLATAASFIPMLL